ncbi:hypothetical protein F4680DRAFT_469381 [Xylaria scruposa]|nr:hypothetical protein F4680DRAFT_469381 [Xylaria scruposa]
MSSSTGQLTAHVNNDESELLCEELNGMTMQGPGSLAAAPAEILINILGYLRAKKDWLCLARSCRRVSNFIVPELDKYTVGDGDYYAVWYACVANKTTILLRHIAFDATIVNRHFTKDFRRKARKIRRNTKFGTRCRFDPEWRVFGKGMTPLSVAIIAGSKAIVQLLLANGADPNRRDLTPVRVPWCPIRVPWYPIHWAVMSKYESSVAIIKMLGAHSVNTNPPTKSLVAALECRGPYAPIFKLLELQKPRWDNIDERETNCEEFNNDLWQLQGLRLRQLEALLLQCGANPNVTYTQDWKTPVFHLLGALDNYYPSFYFDDSLKLSHEGDTQADVVNEIVMLFLDMLRDSGAHIRAIGYFGCRETPLHAACKLNDRHKLIIDWFLRNGVSINSLDSAGCTPLIAYCGSVFKDLDLFRKFLSNGPLINHSDFEGRTALHYLCANRDLYPQVMEKAVKIMLDRGADPTFMSNKGLVPAQELDPAGFKDPSKSFNKDEDTKSRNGKNNERLALTHSEARAGRPDNRPSNREHRAGRGKDRRENYKGGRVDEKADHGTAGPACGRGHNHATPEGSNRGNRRENQRDQKDQRETRRSHQNGGTQHIHGNDDNGKGKDKQDTSRKRRDKEGTPKGNNQSTLPQYTFHQKFRGGTQPRNGDNNNGIKGKETQGTRHDKDNPPQGDDQPAPQYTFHQKVRGGKYCGADQGGHESSRGRPRETKPEVADKSIKPEPAAKQQTSIASQSWFRQRGD